MILKRQKSGAFALAKEIGADGVQLDMGSLAASETFDNKLEDPEVREQFLKEASIEGVAISSIAMSGFYGQSFAERPTVGNMVDDCINTMTAMGVKIAYLPLGVEGDLVKKPEVRPLIVARLREAGKKAEKARVVIAVETALDAQAEKNLLMEIGSPAIKSSFNFANAIRNGKDIPTELRILGKDNIAQIHCSDTDGVWIENNPRLNMDKIKATLEIGRAHV